MTILFLEDSNGFQRCPWYSLVPFPSGLSHLRHRGERCGTLVKSCPCCWPDKSPFWQMICPKNPCGILAKSILPRKKDIYPLRCDFSGESKDKPSDLGGKSPPRTPDPGASQRAFAAQDYGDLREHLAAVVIPSHFHGWEIFIPNGSKWYSRSLWQAFPT